MYTRTELLVVCLKAAGVWPGEEDVAQLTPGEMRGVVHEAAESAQGEALVALSRVAALLGSS